MTVNGILQIGLYLVVLLALVKPLGIYMAKVYLAGPSGSISFSVTSSG
jgi:K+-transporting ATPase A subunit